ncbi:class IV adenylate cyclase [Desulfurococcus amylolyticus]|uniref:Putative adenylyl cyclase CyaB n=1 Tax=Desulfurococcus amylolyticus (strain DSM 18924 / JCM 16383 / VKM B-2413 / 1221n) TaxID=490899 RepID=B8D5C7_DESA1|nr:class IV adenylate cyclase [Desulfurococcus amylolyticus]ACL11308.1 putative adenylyl cyclase CyaB [Desulfurococcus amylolyticus 1221n]
MDTGRKNATVESEVKLQVLVDIEVIEKYLATHGFRKVDECREKDIYFKHPCRDLALSDEAVRLRHRVCVNSGRHIVLTYKGPRENREGVIKTRREIEAYLTPDNASSIIEILDKIGVSQLISFVKNRDIYRGNGLEASIDELKGVGYFLEVEAKEPHAIHLLDIIVRDLSSMAKPIQETYLEICLKTGRCIEE